MAMQEKEFIEGVGTVCEYASKLAAILLRSNADFAEINVANNVDFGLLNEISCEQGERLQKIDKIGNPEEKPSLQLPWISGDSQSNPGDGDTYLVAVRCCTGQGISYREWWEFSFLTARIEPESAWFEDRNGDCEIEWEEVVWCIPFVELKDTLPKVTG